MPTVRLCNSGHTGFAEKLMFHFTSTERQVILFLAISILLGSCVIVVKKRNPELFPEFHLGNATIDRLTADSLRLLPDSLGRNVDAGDTVAMGKININTADVAHLTLLPGIGERMATRILEHRREIGQFQSIEDLIDVPGIGPRTLERFRDQITVGEMPAELSSPPSQEPERAPETLPLININTADAGELERLPGVGKWRIEQIITYREEHGGFRTPEEIMNVPGIGPKTFEALQPVITTGDSLPPLPAVQPVDTIPEPVKSATVEAASPDNHDKININTATAEQLIKLPGIGPKTAQKIIAYRQEHGNFPSVEAIKNVKGIGDHKFEALKSYITVD